MRVSIEVPEASTKSGSLDAAIARQFADIQRQLMRLTESKETSAKTLQASFLAALEEQQASLMKAMERLLGMLGKAKPEPEQGPMLLEAMQSLKQTVTDLPSGLKEALAGQAKSSTAPVTVRPQVTVKMPENFLERIDSLEAALLNGLKRSRSRTFGSNY